MFLIIKLVGTTWTVSSNSKSYASFISHSTLGTKLFSSKGVQSVFLQKGTGISNILLLLFLLFRN